MINWSWVADHIPAILGRASQHIEFALIALVIGFALSFALAIVSVRARPLYPVIAGIAGVLYTIPSLAMFSAFVPVIGLSLLTLEIPLVLYTFVIYIRNMVAGFDSVPPEVLEAADGMGYTRNRRLLAVEVPLALPLIVAGLRLASVSTIGLVTISGILGQSFGGFGFFIFERPTFATEILVGAVGSIALAILADVFFGRVQRWLTPWARSELELEVATAGSGPAQLPPAPTS